MSGATGQAPSPQRDGARALEPADPGALVRLETLLKLAAGAAVGIGALGFPAVAAQLYRFNVPLDYFSSAQAIRAGVLPTVALALGTAGLIVITRWIRAAHLAAAGAGAVLIIPLLLVTIAGGAAFFLVFFWAILWVPTRLLVPFVDLSNRDLLFVAAGVLFLGVLAAGVARVFGLKFNEPKQPQAEQQEADREARTEASRRDFSSRRPAEQRLLIALWGEGLTPRTAIQIVVSVVVCAYCVKLITHLLGIGLSAEITFLRTVAIMGIAGVIVGVSAPLAKVANLDTETWHRSTIQVFAALFLVVYLVSVVLYAWRIYPALPQRFSGGKPEPVTLWVKRDDLPVAVRQSSPHVRVAVEGEWIRLDGLNLLSATSERIILVDRTSPPSAGFVIPRENVKTLIWGS